MRKLVAVGKIDRAEPVVIFFTGSGISPWWRWRISVAPRIT
jgi:hypothetical protein